MRKVLSFVLVLTLVLSSFSMAFAANTTAAPAGGLTDIAGNANQDAIKVAYDLGIVTGNPDGTYLPAKAVTRAEFAALITRALDVPASALAGYTATSFKDTTGYGWAVPYLAFAQSKGIMLGDGNGNVMPGRTITVNEAMTMALRAIGYTANSSMLVGAWPANYVSIAQNNDLYDDVAAKTTVDKASAAQIVYNLLTVQKVSVNSDGATNYLWKGKQADGVEANLLNTNLGATAKQNQILGASGFGYDDSIVNITKDLGAYGDAYVNSDDKVIAFTKDSTALTGKLSDDQKKFEVGDIKYDLGTNTTKSALFLNGDYEGKTAAAVTGAGIAAQAAKADDSKTVTLNVDLSGKTIKDIYSIVAWKATDNKKAASDVQEDITASKPGLLNADFATDDNDAIDMNSFELIGVASLDKIAKDNVLYVYESAKDKVIRKVAVGTVTVKGAVDEVNYADSKVTVGGKEYKVAPSTDGAIDVNDIKYDSEGTFYLDAFGKIYDFDGTNTVNTYGIVKDTQSAGVENFKVKLYTSEDATKTLTFNDAANKIDWTSSSATTLGAVAKGHLIGYSLDGSGEINAIDNTAVSTAAVNVIIKSSKVVNINSKDYNLKSDAVILTYDGTPASPDSVATVKDLKIGACTGTAVQYIMNDKHDVVAMYIEKGDATSVNDAIYGVINTKTTAKNADGDKVYKYTGFINGTAFTYKTDTKMADQAAGVFGVYGFKLDSSNQITDIVNLGATKYNQASPDTNGYLVKDMTIGGINTDKTVVTDKSNANAKYTITDNAVVYKYDADNDTYTVSKLSSLRKDYTVSLFVTNGDDSDNSEATIVIYQEN